MSPSGGAYTNSSHNAQFFKRYANVFDEVVVVARGKRSDTSSLTRIDSKNVTFTQVTDYLGFRQLFNQRRKIFKDLESVVNEVDVVIGRVPGYLGNIACDIARRKNKTFGIEVVGDPYESYKWVSLPWPLNTIVRNIARIDLRRQCRRANAVSYVTKHALQKRYPAFVKKGDGRYTTSYSSVSLPRNNLRKETHRDFKRIIRLINVAGMDQWYKGHDVLIKALSICKKRGLNYEMTLVGDGRLMCPIKSFVAAEGMTEQIHFVGKKSSGDEIFECLRTADIFVLASQTEGLPRVLLEAMSVGLPCISTNVGGCPELISEDYTVQPGDPISLADKLIEVCHDQSQWSKIGLENFKKAAQYTEEYLAPRRTEMYQFLRDHSERKI